MRNCRPMNRDRLPLGLFLFLLVAAIIAPPPLRSQSSSHINGDRMIEHLNAMGALGKDPTGGYSRVAYTDADRQGREYVTGLMRAAGLTVNIDAAGNISGRRVGSDPGLPVPGIGSPVDSVPQGGNYDGIVGS